MSSAKSALRERIRESLRGASAGERARLSQALRANLLRQSIWTDARRVLLFASLAEEPDVLPLLEEAWQAGKTVLLPQFNPANDDYQTCALASSAELIAGRFGVLEPGSGCPVVPLNQLDLVLVPGVAFDLTGRRLGRGKGFYDRLLAQVRGHKCGVCFDSQVVAAVPEEPHDIRLDSILTPTRWQPVRAPGLK